VLLVNDLVKFDELVAVKFIVLLGHTEEMLDEVAIEIVFPKFTLEIDEVVEQPDELDIVTT